MATLKNFINKMRRYDIELAPETSALLQVFTPGAHGYLKVFFENKERCLQWIEIHAEKLADGRILIDPKRVNNFNMRGMSCSFGARLLVELSHSARIYIPADADPCEGIPRTIHLDFRSK